MEDNSPVNIARSARKTAIAVPESARRPKALFWVEPSRKKVLEIIAFIRKTGTPHLHPDITYTQVQPGEIIVFLEMFDLPAEFATNEDKWCLCSACPHDYPQFKKNGILAWFPEQGIIRVVGGDCYKTLNPTGYELAESRYRASREQRHEERYLLRRAWQIPLIISDAQEDRKILASVDDVRAAVIRALHHYEIDLYRHIADGELHVDKPQWDKKSKFGRTVMVPHVHARIGGSSFVDPNMSRFSRSLDKIVRSLSKCDFGVDWEEKIASLSPKRQKTTSVAIAEGLQSLKNLRVQFEDVRAFLSAPTLATLRAWSDHSTSQCRFFFDYSDTELRIGRSMFKCHRIALPTQCYEALAPLPSFSGKDT